MTTRPFRGKNLTRTPWQLGDRVSLSWKFAERYIWDGSEPDIFENVKVDIEDVTEHCLCVRMVDSVGNSAWGTYYEVPRECIIAITPLDTRFVDGE